MQRLIHFFRGSVRLTVTGPFPERFLNLCAQQALAFWALEWLDEHTLRLRLARRDARRAVPLAQRVGCTLETDRPLGLPQFLARFRRRYALLAGMAVSLAAVCLFSQFILTVEVVGNQNVPTAAILSELRRQGVRPGVYGPSLDRRAISHQVLLVLEDLSFLSINLHGTRAEVIVREKDPRPQLLDEKTPSDVVARATGIITHQEVLQGQPLFQEGDTVLAGEVLISGVVDIQEAEYSQVDLGVRLVHAQGRVYARTWRTLTARIPLTAQVKVYTGEELTRYSLHWMGKQVNFYGNAGISFPKYDKITSVRVFTLPSGREMPLALQRETCRAYETQPLSLDPAAAQDLLEARLAQALSEELGEEGEVLATHYSARSDGEELTVTLTAECSEQIAQVVPMAP